MLSFVTKYQAWKILLQNCWHFPCITIHVQTLQMQILPPFHSHQHHITSLQWDRDETAAALYKMEWHAYAVTCFPTICHLFELIEMFPPKFWPKCQTSLVHGLEVQSYMKARWIRSVKQLAYALKLVKKGHHPNKKWSFANWLLLLKPVKTYLDPALCLCQFLSAIIMKHVIFLTLNKCKNWP